MSQLVTEVCRLFQITKLATTSYHPETNAACERMNGFINQTLRAYCNKNQMNWPDIVPSVMAAYRTTPATQSTQHSPYFILFGRECRLPVDVALLPSQNHNIEQHIKRITEAHEVTREVVQQNIKQAQQKYKTQHDKRTKKPNFHIDDRVLIDLRKTDTGLSRKLSPKYIGPYYIVKDFGNYTYKIRACDTYKPMKSLVHANRLKPYVESEVRKTNNDTVEAAPSPDTTQSDTNPDKGNKVATPTLSANKPDREGSQIQNKDNNNSQNSDVKGHDSLEIEKILKASRRNKEGKRWYRVKYKKKHPSEWVIEDVVPHAAIRRFHINNNLSGKKRKRPAVQSKLE
jgi:type II secretory pathway pseudopilin PulG